MPKAHMVVLKDPTGGVAMYPLKEWLRKNPQYLPKGMSPDLNTSHQLRQALRGAGWALEETMDRILLIKPDEEGDTSFAEQLIGSTLERRSESGEDETTAAAAITFGLERDLQSALRGNIEQLEPGLKIIDGGKERVTEGGLIDITAIDASGNTVVVELKPGVTPPEAVAQILAYMGAVAESDNKPVRGILVGGTSPRESSWRLVRFPTSN